jgi:hypothetical protein
MYKGQSLQDKYVTKVLKEKRNGYFIEIGSGDPIKNNNTYLLESSYNWSGIMIEFDEKYQESYILNRPNSIHVFNDATQIDYLNLFQTNNVLSNIDYLQIDLDAYDGSTMKTLNLLNEQIFDNYKFATITFEHDIYRTNVNNTRELSRQIFENRGYLRVFSDVTNRRFASYEDWYVHPDLVDMAYINKIIELNQTNYKAVRLISGASINSIGAEKIIFDI